MTRRFLISALLTIAALAPMAAARLYGYISDKENNPLTGIIVRLYRYNGSSPVSFTRSDKNGAFSIQSDSLPAKLSFSSPKYELREIIVEDSVNPLKIKLVRQAYELNEVIVKAPHTRVKGDTISYYVSAFTAKGDRSIEDVIKKLPGISVDNNGRIYYGEKPISNFYIEGLNLMGNNYSVASRNITPDDISTIDVYERHQAKRVLKGVLEDDRAALNLRLKKGRMLQPVGHVTGGAGYGGNPLWLGKLYGMLISPKNQTIISANGNNAGKPYESLDCDRDGSTAYSIFKRTPFGIPPVSENRFLNNKSAYFTANTLFKLPDEASVKINTSYNLEHSRFDNHTRTEYLGTDIGHPVFEQSVSSGISRHNIYTVASFEKNKESLFISDQAWFNGTFNDNSYDLSRSVNLFQRVRSHNFKAGNKLDAIFRRRGKVYELSSFTSVDNTPVNTLTSTVWENGAAIAQTVKGISITNSESTSFSRLLSRKSTIGMGLFFRADYDKLFSLGETDSKPVTSNDISGFKLRSTATPYYKFSIPGKFSLSVHFPVNLYNINYTDLATGQKYIHNRTYVDFSAKLMYKPSPMFLTNMETGRAFTTGDMSNFVVNPIYTTYRSSSCLGNGALNIARRDFIKGDFNYRNLLEGLYLICTASYSKTKHNTLSVNDVKTDGASTTSSSIYATNRTESTFVSFVATKDVREWSTLFSLNGSGMWNTRNSIRSGHEIRTIGSYYTAGARIETILFSEYLRIDMNAVYSRSIQNFKGLMPNVSLSDFSLNCHISVFPFKSLEIYGKADLRRNQLSSGLYKTNLFIDAGARITIKRFEIELAGTNLTDMRKYEYTICNALDLQNYSYTLRPIEALLTLRYSF